MKIIYKYPLTSNNCILEVPFRCHVLSIQFDSTGELCMWALHEIADQLVVKYQLLVLATGQGTDEPLAEMLTHDDLSPSANPYYYHQTVVNQNGVWHVFMRQLVE